MQSIVTDPEADPHSYQPNAQDARAIAAANMVIINGVGYDEWAHQLVQASPAPGRRCWTSARCSRSRPAPTRIAGTSPADVDAVIAAIAADYERLDPADAAYFAERAQQLQRGRPRPL